MYDQIVVVGNGKTSRANVEALIDDYIYANPKVEVVLYGLVRLSEAQVWLKQYLEDKGIAHKTFLEAIPKGTITSKNAAMFILWNDDDADSKSFLDLAYECSWPAFDLTNGLHKLSEVELPTPIKVEEPVIEQVPVVEDPKVLATSPSLEISKNLQQAIENLVTAILAEVERAR